MSLTSLTMECSHLITLENKPYTCDHVVCLESECRESAPSCIALVWVNFLGALKGKLAHFLSISLQGFLNANFLYFVESHQYPYNNLCLPNFISCSSHSPFTCKYCCHLNGVLEKKEIKWYRKL